MFFLSKYFTGKGLNLTSENISKYPSVSSYKISIVPKYNFIIADFNKIPHQESDLFTFGRTLKHSGVLIIKQKITHEECYNEVLYHVDLLHKTNTNLINFESDEEYNYFVFRKEKIMDSLFVGAYSLDKHQILKALIDIDISSLFSYFFKPLHLYGDNHLWMDNKFMSKLPRFTINCVFTRCSETGFETNENAYNWNRLINVCKNKKLLLINDSFNIEEFSFDKKYSTSYVYIPDIKQARKIGGIDFKYKTLEWAVYDFAIRMGDKINEPAYNEEDKNRFETKKSKGLLDGSIRWINIHEALGDNVCAFNLLESLKRNNNLSVGTAYPFLYDLSGDIKIRYDVWELNGLGFNVYEHGSENKSKTLEYAYFSMNGEEDLFGNRRWKYFYNLDDVAKIRKEFNNKEIVLLAPSASNREGPSNGLMLSNKTWDFSKWEQIVSNLQSKGYYVIQVGVKEDFKVSNVNEYFFNRSFGELVALIIASRFFLGLDTFFQHLCGLMGKKGVVVTPAHNDHAFWPSTKYIVGKVKEDFEHLKWMKDHLNPFRSSCMKSISVDTVQTEVDKIVNSFNKY
jgi:ADP-heptose:LPS heptosyltransferase